MEKLPVQLAEEAAIKAFKDHRIDATLWGVDKDKSRSIDVNFWYPRIDNNINEINIGLYDVRASDGIRVTYDYERDGYSIQQPFIIEVDKGSFIDCEEHWEETAFLQSWALEHKNVNISKYQNE